MVFKRFNIFMCLVLFFLVAWVSSSSLFCDVNESFKFGEWTLRIADLNNDSYLDVLVVNKDGKGNRIWFNDRSGAFFPDGQELGNFQSVELALGDLDGDKDIDAFIINREQPNQVWFNDGSGYCYESKQAFNIIGSLNAELGDLDKDGDLDAVVYHSNIEITIFLNNGSGFFDKIMHLNTVDLDKITILDFDSDGDLDIVGFANDKPVELFSNDGFAIFSKYPKIIETLIPPHTPLIDFTNDGMMDRISVDSSGVPYITEVDKLRSEEPDEARKDDFDPNLERTGGPGAYDYYFTDSSEAGGPAYTWTAGISTALPNCLSCSSSLTIPFTFRIHERDYTSVTADVDGEVSFSSAGASSTVYGWGTNLTTAGSGNWYYGTSGSSPNRIFIVQWDNVPYPDGRCCSSFQIKLFETSNYIEVHYRSTVAPGGGGREATVALDYNSDRLLYAMASSGYNNKAIRYYRQSPEIDIDRSGTSVADGDTYAFGSKALGTNTDVTFTITNNGNYDLELSATNITGTNADQFSITSFPSTPVAAGDTTTFTVRYSATDGGNVSGEVVIDNNDSTENPFNILLTGTGIAPEMDVDQGGTAVADGGSYNFADQLVGTNNDVTFTITNNGTQDLNLDGTPKVSISGADAGQFSVQTQPLSPVASGGGTRTFVIRFAPTSAGTKNASITIDSNDYNEDPYNIDISGNGIAPEMDVDQGGTAIADGGTYDYGDELVGTDTDVTFTITNSGDADLRFDGTPIIHITGVDAGEFSVQSQPNTPVASGGGTTTYQIRFSPTSTGAKTASISISNDDSDEDPYDITLTGNGVAPEMDVKEGTTPIADNGSYDYGDGLVGSDTDITFTIENSGTADLNLGGTPIITITGADAGQFSVQAQPSTPINPSDSTTYIIRFSPTSTGAKTASISIANDDLNEDPYDITLNGTGVAPEMDVDVGGTAIADSGTYDFGGRDNGTNTDITFNVKNNGTADLILSGTPIITITGTDADQFSVQAQPTSPVVPSGTKTFVIRFSPTSSGAKTASISIANSDGNEDPYDI